MKKSRVCLIFLLISLIGILVACRGTEGASDSDEVKSVYKLGALTSTSSSYSYYVAIANSIKEGTANKINVDVVETSASNDNVRLLKRGDIDFGLVTSFTQVEAYEGIGSFEEAGAFKELRMFAPNSIQPVPIFVRADAGIDSVYDLDGKKLNPGTAGSATATSTRLLLDSLGIKPDYVEATLDDAIEMLKNKQIVGLAKGSSSVDLPDASILSLSTLIDVKAIGFSKEDADKLEKEHPNLTRIVVPANIYDGQTEEIETFGQIGAIGATTNLSEEAGYQMFKAIVENKAMQEEAYASIKKLDYADMLIKHSKIPIHPGVVRYLEETGVEVPSELKAE